MCCGKYPYCFHIKNVEFPMAGLPLSVAQLPPAADQYTGAWLRLQLMANPTSGMLAWVISGTPPLSASEVEPTKAKTLGMRSATSAALVEEFWPSSSSVSCSWRPQMPPAASTARNSAVTASAPWLKLFDNGPVSPLTLPNVIDVGVTPVSEAVLPWVPVQAAASARGSKLKPWGAGALVFPPPPPPLVGPLAPWLPDRPPAPAVAALGAFA